MFYNDKVTEYTEEQIVERGNEAKAILDSPLFDEAIEEAVAHILRGWYNSVSTAERESAWGTVRGFEGVRSALRTFQSDGEHASKVIAIRRAKDE